MKLAIMVGAVLVGLSGAAKAAPILAQNTTNVTLTAAPVLTSLGISVAPIGSATVSVVGGVPVASFGITGGTANSDGSLLIQHDGSGLRFSQGATIISLGNFLIDTKQGIVFGSLGVRETGLISSPIPVFTIGSGLSLSLSGAAAGLFNAGFGTSAFSTATVVGSATTNPVIGPATPGTGTAVPEPASLALLAFALVGMIATLRFRRFGRFDGQRLAAT